MRKKVLLAEQSGSTRSVIETILRQNGFEVVSVPDYEKAVDVLGLSKPDIMIFGSDLTGAGNKHLYTYINENEIYSSIPILLLASAEDTDLPYPDEVIVRRPFDTNELLEKIKIFAGQDTSKANSESNSPTPMVTMDLDDEFLDAALGLDQIDVTDSEVMNKTGNIPKVKTSSSKITSVGEFDDLDDSSKVESIIIDEDQTDIRRPATKITKSAPMNASGKLDILQDQYGMSEKAQKSLEPDDSAHDYNWFVNEMQSDSKPNSGSDLTANKESNDLGAVKMEETLQPLTAKHINDSTSKNSKTPDEGVEKFIDDFKNEMNKIHSDTKTETITINDDNNQSGTSSRTNHAQLNEQKLTDSVELFTRQFTAALAEKLAKVIVDKIDSERLFKIIKNEVLTELKKK